jgi:hypothetical protein
VALRSVIRWVFNRYAPTVTEVVGVFVRFRTPLRDVLLVGSLVLKQKFHLVTKKFLVFHSELPELPEDPPSVDTL